MANTTLKRARTSERGFAILATLIVTLIVSVLGVAVCTYGMTDLMLSANSRDRVLALHAADAGLDQTLAAMMIDSSWIGQVVDTAEWTLVEPFPSSVTINGVVVSVALDASGDPIPDYYALGATTTLGSAAFSQQVYLPPTVTADGTGRATVGFKVRSTGRGGVEMQGTQIVRSLLEFDLSNGSSNVWDNAIFAGDGVVDTPLRSFSDSVTIRGSIHVVADPSSPLVEIPDNVSVLNHYEGIDATSYFGADQSKLPTLQTVSFRGESVGSLAAKIRVRDGNLHIADAMVGEPDAPLNTVKETLDGFYVDGTVTGGLDNSYYDQSAPYDLNTITFPHLDGSYCGDPLGTGTQREYLETNSLAVDIDKIDLDEDAFHFEDGNGNLIDWDPSTGVLTVEGIIKFSNRIRLGDASGGPDDPGLISYAGTGTLYAPEIEVRWDLMPVDDYLDPGGATTHSLGLIAEDRMNLAAGDGGRPVKIMAAMYSDDEFIVDRDARLAGAAVGADFKSVRGMQMSHVPSLPAHLPPGMPGCDSGVATIHAARFSGWYLER